MARALTDIAAGRPVVVVDDDRAEGAVVFAAEKATPALMAFTVRHTCGLVAVALPGADCDRLQLRPMNGGDRESPYTVTVDAKNGVHTGISAADRAYTARLLASPDTAAADLSRPGHLMGLRVHGGGVLHRPQLPEAAVDLARLGGLRPAGVLCELVSPRDPTRMARASELAEFTAEHDLALVSIAGLVRHRVQTELVRGAVTRQPVAHSEFQATSVLEGAEHVVVVDERAGVLVRLHRECPGAIGGVGPEVELYLRVPCDGD
ncbi:3,4-dihydroxy-2-butanone-4-phosphate synthase [Amycolatopsis methanolica]|uniref:3,4-dihydroxy-2-butanone-4-phosphate synthase n=1 Tax=Amycolatopsis methanolica 239 TaxID=1068978 RepID=A0A076MVH5_AMYME|nr:3,4-dihydroxy-2-butanone-4-phosphate synthase [Amycolatopsis methanolica]AIJ24704.1 bifunctional 3,4-dihydroxy-2-butanone 4-phosphate synthase/GTP cyclohydrolase II protein [Amycolatopsis methanolica 239]